MGKYVTVFLLILFFGFLVVVYSTTKLFYPANQSVTSDSSMTFEEFGSEKQTEESVDSTEQIATNASSKVVLEADGAAYNEGETITVDVQLDADKEIVATQFIISFDPNVVSFVDATPGDYFNNPREVGPTSRGAGLVEYALLVLPADGTATGEGTLMSLEFTAVGAGETDILVENGSMVGAINANGKNDLASSTVATIVVE